VTTTKTEKTEASGYGDVVGRLQQIVESLEGGELSLEASLERFAEGVQLVKRGEKLLAEAEKRVEQLLSDDGRTAPLNPGETAPAGAKAAPARRPGGKDDDVPF
jgi:exodeoxyribonuclease VII small subunit